MRTNFISFIDKNETQVMHTKSDNIEGLETKMKGSSYIFERTY